jgi:tRNA threonylcarbamoyladenosine biosynthesis protein TsaE
MDEFSLDSVGPEGTGALAAVLARQLVPGDVVLLRGGLASGKTIFVKAVAEALESPDPVTSPTFMLAQFYVAWRAPILHIDTYRLADVAEFRDLALEDHFATSMTFVEWGDLVAGEFDCHLTVELAVDPDRDDGRTLTFSSGCPRWTAVLPVLRSDMTAEVA